MQIQISPTRANMFAVPGPTGYRDYTRQPTSRLVNSTDVQSYDRRKESLHHRVYNLEYFNNSQLDLDKL